MSCLVASPRATGPRRDRRASRRFSSERRTISGGLSRREGSARSTVDVPRRCFGLNSQIIVGVLYAKVAFYSDAALAATLCLPRALIVVLHALAVLTGKKSPGFLVVVIGELATLACVYGSLPEKARVSVVGVPPSPGRLVTPRKRM